jgi:NIMA (never in mitosis gene a)-related kinase
VHIKKGTKFPEEEIWKVAEDLLCGAKFLHENKILHRDIKAANIFFSSGIAKLGDMNVSRVLKEEKFAKTQTGTPYYTSP